MALRRRVVDTQIEEKIITAMITNTQFLREIAASVQPEYFQQQHCGIIARWVIDYFKKYREAPYQAIESIYYVEKAGLKESDSELVAELLSGLSDKYDDNGPFSVDYLKDQSMKYFHSRSMLLLGQDLTEMIEAGRTDQADKRLADYRKTAKTLSLWVNPFDVEYAKIVFGKHFMGEKEEDNEDFLFRFPGALDRIMGPMQRNWLVAWEGVYKRGKTHHLTMSTIIALTYRLRVCFVSLEMQSDEVTIRSYKNVTSYTFDNKTYKFPVFDCLKNQDNTCKKPQCPQNNRAVIAGENKLKFEDAKDHIVCTACRGKRDYKSGTWFEEIGKEKPQQINFYKLLRGIMNQYGDNLRVISYPAATANLAQVMSDIDNLEYTEGFIPDMIVIDYADILAPEDSRVAETRHRIDETWKMLKRISQERHCLVMTATQTNKKVLSKKLTKAEDVAEEGRKLGHVDAMFTLNQTDDEKDDGIMRIGCVMHRHRKFNPGTTVTVLQQLDAGQVVLDAE